MVLFAAIGLAPFAGAAAGRAYVSQVLEKPGEREAVVVTLNLPEEKRDPSQIPAAVAALQHRLLGRLASQSYRVRAQYSHLPVLAIEASPAVLRTLAAHPSVRAINPDRPVYLADAESAALTRIAEVHAVGGTGAGIRVAVVDSGINTAHSALADDLVAEVCVRLENDCPNGPSSAEDENGHGTHVSGIITGTGGVAPDAEFIAVKVFGAAGVASTATILNGLNTIVANHEQWHTNIVNMSLAGAHYADQATCDAENAGYVSALSTLDGLGIAVFVASGNAYSTEAIGAPACVSGAIAVGSVDDAVVSSQCPGGADAVSCYSNTTPMQGPGELLDLLAPGCRITAEWIGGSTATHTICGTSMASPTAAGIAAALLSIDPTLTPAALEEILEATGERVTDHRNAVVYPRIDAAAAHRLVAITLPNSPSPLTAAAISSTEIQLLWNDITDEAGYEIQRSAEGGAWETVAQVAADTTGWVDFAATCGTTAYRTIARAPDGGYSAASNLASALARACPQPPSGFVATAAGTDAQLAWTDQATDETSYRVERLAASGWSEIATLPAGAQTFIDEGPGCGTRHYRVRSHRGALEDYSPHSEARRVDLCAPANDLIANAEPVLDSRTDDEPAIRYATVSADDPVPSCLGVRGAHSIWYVIEPASDQSVLVATTGSTMAYPAVSVHAGAPGALTEIACALGDASSNWQVELSNLNLSAGVRYYVLLSRNSSVPMQAAPLLRTSFGIGEWQPPGNFDLFTPPNGFRAPYLPNVVGWTEAFNAQSYELSIRDEVGEVLSVAGISGWSYEFTAADRVVLQSQEAIYTWFVSAQNAQATRIASNGPFTFEYSRAPGEFSAALPVEGQRFVAEEMQPTFSWTSAASATSYTLKVNDTSGTVLEIAGISQTHYALQRAEIALISQPGRHSWSVTATNIYGSTVANSAPRGFMVQGADVFGHGFE